MDRLERDFYSVEIDADDKKRIHIHGYCYAAEDDTELPYRCLEFAWFFLPIGFTQEQYDEMYCKCKTYLGDFDEDGIVGVMDGYGATPLPLSSVTEDTPCGTYIDV